MKLKKLIKTLKKYRKEYGNLPVEIENKQIAGIEFVNRTVDMETDRTVEIEPYIDIELEDL